MPVLDRIAYYQERRDELPNQELAHDLAAASDREGVAEIAAHLWDRNSSIASDCLKVLYEVGYLAPELIADYTEDFFLLLSSKNNRMRWGGMIALSTVASIRADAIHAERALIIQTMKSGTVITLDAGVTTLSRVAETSDERRGELMPFLLDRIETCRLTDVARYGEKVAVAIDLAWVERFTAVLEARLPDLSASQATRVRRILRSTRDRLAGACR